MTRYGAGCSSRALAAQHVARLAQPTCHRYTPLHVTAPHPRTQSALQVLARMLHTRPHAFGFAGTKDKRGVTSQHVTLFKADPARLAALNPRCGDDVGAGVHASPFPWPAGAIGQLAPQAPA
jgi:hypothetical protein